MPVLTRPAGCGDAAGVPVRARRSRGRRAPSPGAAGKETPPPSPSTCPAVRRAGLPQTLTLCSGIERPQLKGNTPPTKPLIACWQQGFCPKRWGLAPFCSSCSPQEQGWGSGAAAGRRTPCHSTPSQSPRASCASQSACACLLPARSRARPGDRGGREPEQEKDPLASVKAASTELAALASPSPAFPVRCVA